MKYDELDKGQTYGDMVILGRFSYIPLENVIESSTSILGYIYFKDTRLFDNLYNKLCKYDSYKLYLLCTEKTLTSQNIYLISKDCTYKNYYDNYSSSHRLGKKGQNIDIKHIDAYLSKMILIGRKDIFRVNYKGYTLKEVKDTMYTILASKEYQKVYKSYLDGIKRIFMQSFVQVEEAQKIIEKDLDYDNSMLFDNVYCVLVKTKKGFGFIKDLIGDFLIEDYKLKPKMLQNHNVFGDTVYYDISRINELKLLKVIKPIKDDKDVLEIWNSYLYTIVYQGEVL